MVKVKDDILDVKRDMIIKIETVLFVRFIGSPETTSKRWVCGMFGITLTIWKEGSLVI